MFSACGRLVAGIKLGRAESRDANPRPLVDTDVPNDLAVSCDFAKQMWRSRAGA